MADQEPGRRVALSEKGDSSRMTEIAMSQRGPAVPVFSNMADLIKFADMMSRSAIGVRKHLRDNPGACAAICLQAQRWAMDPYMVANKSYLVSDQIAYESQLLTAVINTRAPIKGRLRVDFDGEGGKRRCRAYATFIGEEEPAEVWSPPFADITPKNSPLWKSDPDQQLAYYTKRAWARRECPEVLLGVYDVEELEEVVRGELAKDINERRPQRADYGSGEVITDVAVDFDLVTDSDGLYRSYSDPENAAEELGKLLRAAGDESEMELVWARNADLVTAFRERGATKAADMAHAVRDDLLAAYDKEARAAVEARRQAKEKDEAEAKAAEQQEREAKAQAERDRIAAEQQERDRAAAAKQPADTHVQDKPKPEPEKRAAPAKPLTRKEDFFAQKSYEIAVPEVKGTPSWTRWSNWMTEAARDAINLDELDKLRDDNAEHWKALDHASKGVGDNLRTIFADRREELDPASAAA